MPELPASVRLALWATTALASGSIGLEDAVRAATPDIPEVDAAPAVARLDLWDQLGERAVLVSLPVPGDLVSLPRGTADFVGAAVDAEECAWSPLVGGALIPTVETYGSTDELGEIVRWESFDTTPCPPEVPSVGEVERHLRGVLTETTRALEGLDAPVWKAGLRELADRRLAAGNWGLPPGLDGRVQGVVVQAATVERIATTALETLHDAPTLAVGQERERLLRGVRRDARRSLAAATCLGALALADGSVSR